MALLKKNIPNMITLSRIVFSIVLIFFIYTFFNPHVESTYIRYFNAYLILCFLAIILSDVIDGYLARKMDLVTGTGAKLDIAADMIYVLGTVIALVHNDKLQIWFPIVLIINFVGFIVTSKVLSKHRGLQVFAVFDKLGKTAACLTMLLPGLFAFRCLMSNYELVMRVSVLIITWLFFLSFIYRVTMAIKLKNE